MNKYKFDCHHLLDAESLARSKAENNKYVIVHFSDGYGIGIKERGLNPFYTEESKGLNMKLKKEDIGEQFNTRCGEVALIVHYSIDECCVSTGTGVDAECLYLVNTRTGKCDEDYDISITSRHDPRSWLSQMPNLGDIKDGWIVCDSNGGWYWSNGVPVINPTAWILDFGCSDLYLFNMPTLTGDQWKDSKISVAELKKLQVDNEVGSCS